ncbi:hypothetical protein PsAD13_03176 [Pseudovibrio sp. Ad13]|uniref:helix-turn-helix transcriptional regulator n=1 Tax=Pseudovibrio sp. Ad13 TaxID=989396 RepID=UPI0007AEB551|nr:hypothetical protein [Pseudovibrio sp. Ad13]KZK82974.1 hypothetical protein PsAD13_03176 [Pseudovibrio sp. Ad13]
MQRLLSKQQAAEYCGLSVSGFDNWIEKGLAPPPLPGTQRWDKKAIDLHFDRMSGLQPKADNENPLDSWLEARRAS